MLALSLLEAAALHSLLPLLLLLALLLQCWRCAVDSPAGTAAHCPQWLAGTCKGKHSIYFDTNF
jgi:hypothetical protein